MHDDSKYTHTEFVVCPYCLYENQDCWEYNKGNEGGFDAWCDSCGKKFRCERILNIHFNSTPDYCGICNEPREDCCCDDDCCDICGAKVDECDCFEDDEEE